MMDQLPEPAWGPIGLDVFERTYSRTKPDGSKESWRECVKRTVLGNMALVHGEDMSKWSDETLVELYQLTGLMYNMAIIPAGRHLWSPYTAGQTVLGNCHAPHWTDRLSDHVSFAMLRLLEGGGTGSDYSRSARPVYPAPAKRLDLHIVCREDHPDYQVMLEAGVLSRKYSSEWTGAFEVGDSREGWAAVVTDFLDDYYRVDIRHRNRIYDISQVRPAGAKLKRFGGTASGPLPLAQLLQTIERVMNNRAHWQTSVTAMDLLEIDHGVAAAVVAGGVRRSARMSLLRWDDPEIDAFLNMKKDVSKHWSTNQSVIIDSAFIKSLDDPYSTASKIHALVVEGMLANGEPGYVNLEKCQEGEVDPVVTVNPCQPAWAPVLTPDGIRPLGDVEVGSEIWSEDGWVTVERKWSNGVKPVFRYATTAGFVDATREHRVVQSGAKVPLADAVAIDRLRGGQEGTHAVSPDAVMAGLVLGDGYLHKATGDRAALCIGGKDQDYFDSEISHLIEARSSGHVYWVKSDLTRDDVSERTYDRRIPARYLHGEPAELASLLRGLYSANGSLAGGRVTLKATSYGMIDDVQLALSSLGIASYHTTNKESVIEWSNGTYTSKASRDLNISGAEDIARFGRLIGFIQRYKEVPAGGSKRPKVPYPIREVANLGEHEVFDITVSGPSHTYWSGGMNVSNCGEATLEAWGQCLLGSINMEAFVPKDGNVIAASKALVVAHKLLVRFLIRATFGDYADEKQRAAQHRSRRVGVGHMGVAGYLAKVGMAYSEASDSDGFAQLLTSLHRIVKQEAADYCFALRIPLCVKTTAQAPTGSISQLPGVTPGIMPIFGRYYERRVRYSKTNADQVAQVDKLRAQGYHVEDCLYAADTCVVTYPCKDRLLEQVEEMGGDVSKVESVDELSVDAQLSMAATYQKYFCDQAVSFTVNVDPDKVTARELSQAIRRWLPELKGCAVFPEVSRPQAPYIRISQAEYEAAMAKDVGLSNDPDCTTGCPIR